MSEIGYGYGSEWHLLRYLGYHRGELDRAVKRVMEDVKEIEWLDHRFDPARRFGDAELRGVEFLLDDEPAKIHWPTFWPTTGNPPNWDAVALVTLTSNDLCWVLVEAKAHLKELDSCCGASNPESQAKIQAALQQVKQAAGVDADRDWTSRYYQHANRLAVLHHFIRHGPPMARLLNIYFLGDTNPHAVCPKTVEEWQPALQARDEVLGLTHQSDLERHVYSMFLPTIGDNHDYGGARA